MALHFHFALRPANYVASPAVLVSVTPTGWCGRERDGKEQLTPTYLANFEILSLSVVTVSLAKSDL